MVFLFQVAYKTTPISIAAKTTEVYNDVMNKEKNKNALSYTPAHVGTGMQAVIVAGDKKYTVESLPNAVQIWVIKNGRNSQEELNNYMGNLNGQCTYGVISSTISPTGKRVYYSKEKVPVAYMQGTEKDRQLVQAKFEEAINDIYNYYKQQK